MIIIFNALNFSPEIVGNGKYTSEKVFWLSKKVEKIIVITTNPYYPQWKCYSNKYKREENKRIIVLRCPVYIPKKINGLTKIIHYLSFLLSSLPIAIYSIKFKPDLVFTVCPTFFSVPSTFLISALTKIFFKKKVKTWIHYQDLEIEAAFNLKILRGKTLKKIILYFEKIIINQFSVISTISNGMMGKLQKKIDKNKKILFLPNFIEFNKKVVNYQNKKDNPLFEELNLPNECKIVMYSGSLNEKLSYRSLINAIKYLKDRKNIFFIISGEGPLKDYLLKNLEGFDNAIIKPFQPVDKLQSWLNIADIHLIPQKFSVSNLVLPSKLLGILSSQKPVIGFAPEDSDLGKILDEVGVRIPKEEPELLAKGILNLTENIELRRELGLRGYEYVKKYYDKESVLTQLFLNIKKIIN